MAFNIVVVGTGYVGLVTAVGMAEFGNNVVGIDRNASIIENLNDNRPHIHEESLSEYMGRNVAARRLCFSVDIEDALSTADVLFITVGTPPLPDGMVDLSQIEGVIDTIAPIIRQETSIILKSTIPVGSTRAIFRRLADQFRIRGISKPPLVVFNPEFLREGSAWYDFFHPDRVIIGYQDPDVLPFINALYRPLNIINVPFVWCNYETAELIKYANNSFLATKITFINQIANFAEKVGADVHVIAKAMGMDGRISPHFLHPGPGFGGSCFPKDVQALVTMGESAQSDMSLLHSVIAVNEKQRWHMVEKLRTVLDPLKGRRVALLGLSFKEGTDDVRESPAVHICELLLQEGIQVSVFDPYAVENFKKIFAQRVRYTTDVFEAVEKADACMILTRWNGFRHIDFKQMRAIMADNVIIDTCNVLDISNAVSCGFRYQGVGRVGKG